MSVDQLKLLGTEVYYLPLEPNKNRMSELMSCPGGWFDKAFERAKCNVVRIEPAEATSMQIKAGKVLDRVNRPVWALRQVASLLEQSPEGGNVFFEDMFHPGIEALAYSGRPYKLYTYCWAQSFDIYDFTRDMLWMRAYEQMIFDMGVTVFVASPGLKELIHSAFPRLPGESVVVTGLPFDSRSVQTTFDPQLEVEPISGVFSSRFDMEKQPEVFLRLVEELSREHPSLSFAVCTGAEDLRGDAYKAIQQAKALEEAGKLRIYRNLTKAEYYAILRRSAVQVNTSLQDWVSFTLLEALACGCAPCYPLFRDFAYWFSEFPEYTYAPQEGRIDSLKSSFLHVYTSKLSNSPSQYSVLRRKLLSIHNDSVNVIANAIAR